MDGVDQLNNILIIGMTNRLDMIDEALLRPGRLEVHMEISLPDEKGRLQILNIHTAKMRTNQIMDRDVDLEELAAVTKNFSGAEISGLVKSATSFAFNRHVKVVLSSSINFAYLRIFVKVGTMAGISNDVEDLRVNRNDFMSALDEVHPAFGVSEEELQQVVQNGIIHYDRVIDVRCGCFRLQLFLTNERRSFFVMDNCSLNKFGHRQELHLSACFFMDHLDLAKQRWLLRLPRRQVFLSSSLYRPNLWSDLHPHRRLQQSIRFSRTVIKVP